MPTRSVRGRSACSTALVLALCGGFAEAQEAEEAAAASVAAPGRDARGEAAPVVAPAALLELPYVYPLLPMRPPPAPR